MSALCPGAALIALLLPMAAVAAQDPPAPPGGFGHVLWQNNPVTWADGYQTRMDVYEPAAPAPATGWPGVLVVHGGGGSKNIPEVTAKAVALASAGFVCYAYDVRGDGSTPALNPGWPSFATPEEKLHDSAESHSQAQALLPGKIDPARLAVTGFSQGGQHAIEAAAWSGKPIPCPIAGCAVASYPMILAAAPQNVGLDWIEKTMPGAVVVNDETVDDLGPTNPFLLLLDADDYPGAYAWLQGQHSYQVLGELQQSSVPVHATFAWQDLKLQLNSSADALWTLLPGVPRRLYLRTGGHSTPKNDMEDALLVDVQRRWFERFLKGVANGVELEAAVEVAVQPDDPAYSSAGSAWEHRSADTWPPPIAPTVLHLRGNGSLTAAAPAAAEIGPTVAHTVAAGLGAVAWVQQNMSTNLALATANVPLQSAAFQTLPLSEAMELFGRGRAVLHVDDTTGVFQLSAALSHVDPSGASHSITMGTGGHRSGIAGAQVLEVELGDIAHVIPAGNRLRLVLSNLGLHVTPSYQRIRFLPYFTDTITTVELGPGIESRVELPLRAYVPNLAPRFAVESSAAGFAHALRVSGGAGRAGWIYLVVLGGSGEAPGTPLPGAAPVPLNVDVLTVAALSAVNSAFLPAFLGALDAQGFAYPGVVLPAGALPGLVGTRLALAGLLVDPSGALETVGPATLLVLP